MIPLSDVASFKDNGYLIVRDFLSPEEITNLKSWAQEVHDYQATESSDFMPYEEVNAKGERVLCRTENFANSHAGFNSLLRGAKLLHLLEALSGEPMHLFKEKINYKLAGSGGFAPHIDAVAYTHIKDVRHLTILLSVDPSNMTNGGLEVVSGSHEVDVPINPETNCIADEWVASQRWTPAELDSGEYGRETACWWTLIIVLTGELLIFTSYLAHRSEANHSSSDRKAVYATYNLASEGDNHKSYYEHRKVAWPASHMRKDGEKYDKGSLTYGFGSPMLSVDAGKQLIFS
ncbi:Phytanoyl-dioxygenase [Cordyceps militaris]|uniref:Phytanoyl-dioxygenase n=1 Tax=Cordyceps militaris TaxID=73501 RepID=A0A2H4SEW2_CORMI|nr:Phytanoyl-dioxygenase [Cordyceps militaris]